MKRKTMRTLRLKKKSIRILNEKPSFDMAKNISYQADQRRNRTSFGTVQTKAVEANGKILLLPSVVKSVKEFHNAQLVAI